MPEEPEELSPPAEEVPLWKQRLMERQQLGQHPDDPASATAERGDPPRKAPRGMLWSLGRLLYGLALVIVLTAFVLMLASLLTGGDAPAPDPGVAPKVLVLENTAPDPFAAAEAPGRRGEALEPLWIWVARNIAGASAGETGAFLQLGIAGVGLLISLFLILAVLRGATRRRSRAMQDYGV